MKRSSLDSGKPRLPALEKELLDFLEEHEANIQIDEHDLIGCQRQQSASYYAVSKRHAFEVSKYEAAKHYLKMVSARVEDAIRSAAKEDGEKLTESTVAARVLLDPEVREAEEQLSDSRRASLDVQALKDSFQQRSLLLRDMASLWIAGYYSDSAIEGADRAVNKITSKRVKGEIARRHKRERE